MRLQEIEIEKDCKRLSTFLKHIKKTHPRFWEEWGETITEQFENDFDRFEQAGEWVLWTEAGETYYYCCFIVFDECHIIDGEN